MHIPLTLTTTAAAALAAVALCASPAQAATLSFSAGTMTYTAAPGERNSLRVNDGGNDRPDMFAVLDYAPITSFPADRCEELAESYVRCLTAGTAMFRAVLGDDDDGFSLDTFAPPLALDVDGGDGADHLVGARTAAPRRSPPPCAAARVTTSSTAAPGTTPSTAARAGTSSSARRAPTRSTAGPATTRSTAARATTRCSAETATTW
jgi:hypothetical protein